MIFRHLNRVKSKSAHGKKSSWCNICDRTRSSPDKRCSSCGGVYHSSKRRVLKRSVLYAAYEEASRDPVFMAEMWESAQ